MTYLKAIENEDHATFKINKQKEIVKIRAEMNKLIQREEYKESMKQNIDSPQTEKTEKFSAKLTKKRAKLQLHKIRVEREDKNTDTSEIRLAGTLYLELCPESSYAHNFFQNGFSSFFWGSTSLAPP